MIGVADVETTLMHDGRVPKTKFWGLGMDDQSYRKFENSPELWKYLKALPESIIYCHHDYDLIQAHVDKVPLTIENVRGGRILSAKSHDHIEWRNSYAMFPAPLKEILETCGFKKPSLRDLEKRNKADTKDALAAFFMLAEKYKAVWGIYPLGGKYLTAASVAFASAELHAGKLPLWLDDRGAYKGGRTEAFRIGQCGDADLYDINSSYPAAFTEAPLTDTLVYAEVKIEGDGPMPFWRNPTQGKLIFPRGTFNTVFFASNYEKYIKPHGGVVSIKAKKVVRCDLSWLVRCATLIRHAYTLRAQAKKSGDTVMAYACKLGLNSIYGRLGMKPVREKVEYRDNPPNGDDVTWFDLPRGKCVAFTQVISKPRANYLLASYVTDNARARLYHAMRSVGEVFYCDTDSIYLPKGSVFPLTQGSGLGEWKKEHAAKLSIVTLKDYRFGQDRKRKGGKGGYVWTIKRALDNKSVRQDEKHRRCKRGYRCRKARIVAGRCEKCRDWIYDKRVVLETGETLPITIK